MSSEIFQRKLNKSLEGMMGVVCVADEILIFGISAVDHDENLRNLLIRYMEPNIKLNKDKCAFKTAELDFLGHVVTNKGLKADQKNVEAILHMSNGFGSSSPTSRDDHILSEVPTSTLFCHGADPSTNPSRL